jgi:carbon monoxide dehydrogenase subunit G
MERTDSVLIDHPVGAVWAILGDVNRWPEWIPDVSGLSPLAEGETKVGAVLEYEFRGRAVRAEITGLEPERLLAVHSPDKGYDFDEIITLEAEGDGTRVSVTWRFEPTVLLVRAVMVLIVPFKWLFRGRGTAKAKLAALSAAVAAQSKS